LGPENSKHLVFCPSGPHAAFRPQALLGGICRNLPFKDIFPPQSKMGGSLQWCFLPPFLPEPGRHAPLERCSFPPVRLPPSSVFRTPPSINSSPLPTCPAVSPWQEPMGPLTSIPYPSVLLPEVIPNDHVPLSAVYQRPIPYRVVPFPHGISLH